jgi:DNA-binding NarL/FixJ family response regulator
MARVVAFVDDLIFQAKLVETVRQLTVELKLVTSDDALAAEVQARRPALVVVDLNARCEPVEALEKLRAAGEPIRIVAFPSPGQTELAERARAAGWSGVLTRSNFVQDLATILETAKSEQP